MEFSKFIAWLAELDLEPRIVDGRVVLHGPQENVTPEIEAIARYYREFLHTYAVVEGADD